MCISLRQGLSKPSTSPGGEAYIGRYCVPGLVELHIIVADQHFITQVRASFHADLLLTPKSEHQVRIHRGPSNGELAVFMLDEAGRAQQVIVGGFV
jgi:hypothetical protein